jgi:hypothetical protein
MNRIIYFFFISILLTSCIDSEKEILIENKIDLEKQVQKLELKLDSINNLPIILFNHALKKETDSQNLAKNIYIKLIELDSNNYWSVQAESRLAFLNSNNNKVEFIKKFSGLWKWKERYTNWGDIDSPFKCNCSKKLKIIDGNIAEFYENGNLKRKTVIEIVTEPDLFGGGLIKLIKFKDDNSIKEIYISKESNELVFREPKCVCGCTTDSYKRI